MIREYLIRALHLCRKGFLVVHVVTPLGEGWRDPRLEDKEATDVDAAHRRVPEEPHPRSALPRHLLLPALEHANRPKVARFEVFGGGGVEDGRDPLAHRLDRILVLERAVAERADARALRQAPRAREVSTIVGMPVARARDEYAAVNWAKLVVHVEVRGHELVFAEVLERRRVNLRVEHTPELAYLSPSVAFVAVEGATRGRERISCWRG
mmetsp:Transcript_14882/g.48763  ORF Transcript_14882/g.48763 Transcript_14882/m.48763 type:complete len:210 (+) Transcript_14882:1282-1911(+)